MFGIAAKAWGSIKGVARGQVQKNLGLHSPNLPSSLVRIGRFLYLGSATWIGGAWYTSFVNSRTTPGEGPKLILPGRKPRISPPSRADPKITQAVGTVAVDVNATAQAVASGVTFNTKGNGAKIIAQHPELKPGISHVTVAILNQFPRLIITATTNGGHASKSYHYQGRAVDLSIGDAAYMKKAAGWIAVNLTKNLVEGIHNPNLSVKNGLAVPPSFWGALTWSEHSNHIHVAV